MNQIWYYFRRVTVCKNDTTLNRLSDLVTHNFKISHKKPDQTKIPKTYMNRNNKILYQELAFELARLKLKFKSSIYFKIFGI